MIFFSIKDNLVENILVAESIEAAGDALWVAQTEDNKHVTYNWQYIDGEFLPPIAESSEPVEE